MSANCFVSDFAAVTLERKLFMGKGIAGLRVTYPATSHIRLQKYPPQKNPTVLELGVRYTYTHNTHALTCAQT